MFMLFINIWITLCSWIGYINDILLCKNFYMQAMYNPVTCGYLIVCFLGFKWHLIACNHYMAPIKWSSNWELWPQSGVLTLKGIRGHNNNNNNDNDKDNDNNKNKHCVSLKCRPTLLIKVYFLHFQVWRWPTSEDMPFLALFSCCMAFG